MKKVLSLLIHPHFPGYCCPVIPGQLPDHLVFFLLIQTFLIFFCLALFDEKPECPRLNSFDLVQL